jgi:hypothetical protein
MSRSCPADRGRRRRAARPATWFRSIVLGGRKRVTQASVALISSVVLSYRQYTTGRTRYCETRDIGPAERTIDPRRGPRSKARYSVRTGVRSTLAPNLYSTPSGGVGRAIIPRTAPFGARHWGPDRDLILRLAKEFDGHFSGNTGIEDILKEQLRERNDQQHRSDESIKARRPRSRGRRSLPRCGRPAIGLILWSLFMNVIRTDIVCILPFERNSSVRRANERRLNDDRRALQRSLRRGSSGDQDRCLRFASRREGLTRQNCDRPGRSGRRWHPRDRRDRCRPIARLAQGKPVKSPDNCLINLTRSWFEFDRNASRFVRSVVGP